MKRYLILEDGTSFAGESFGAETISTGELAVQTSNFGYQEALTDPTNAGKILVFLLYMGLILVHLPIRLVTKVKLKLLLWILMMSMHLIRLEP